MPDYENVLTDSHSALKTNAEGGRALACSLAFLLASKMLRPGPHQNVPRSIIIQLDRTHFSLR
jgi:hypothetical protein